MTILDWRRIGALLVLALLGLSWSAARGDDPPPQSAALEEIAAKLFEKSAPPGLSVAVMRDGAFVFARGFGLADLENDVACTPQTVYRIASVSKPIAAVAVLQMVEQGKASLDDPIQKYVPEFPEKPEGPVTLRHLLTHTAGVRHYKPGEFIQRDHYDTLVKAIGIFKDDPLLFAPGEKFSYSSYGYNLLAGVVEKASGQDFGKYLKQHVFDPAGMTSSRLELQGELVPHRARQYERFGRSSWQNAPFVDLSIKWAGGGIISTVEDLCRLDLALAEGKLLKPETIELMQTPGQLNSGKAIDYALGWRIDAKDTDHPRVSHSGGTAGGTSFLLRMPKDKVAVTLIANGADVSGLPGAAQALAKAALQAESP